MAAPYWSIVFVDWRKVVRYGPLDLRWMDKIMSRNNLSFLSKSEPSRAKSTPQIILGFSFVKYFRINDFSYFGLFYFLFNLST
jgi:hypothetical protein